MRPVAASPDPGILAGMELFVDLPPAALIEIMACAHQRPLAKNETVFTQGQRAERCHALVTGRIRISQSGEDGAQLLVRFIGPGEMFGTVALFTDRAYPAEAVAMVDSTEISWTETALLDLIDRHPRIALNIVGIVGARLREVQERLRELSTQRVESRIAHTLLRLAEQAGQADRDGTKIDFPLTRKDLAAMCGATLHTASRILRAWEKAALISTSRQRITIRKPSALRRIAEETPE
jgi:CRP-like cAMP-binding protein